MELRANHVSGELKGKNIVIFIYHLRVKRIHLKFSAHLFIGNIKMSVFGQGSIISGDIFG